MVLMNGNDFNLTVDIPKQTPINNQEDRMR